MNKHYFAYIRVSTKKQGNGASLTEQRAAIDAFARTHGLNIVEWYCELRTAAKAGRREFAKMLRELKRGRVAGVIIHKVDRSARNGRDWVEIGELVDRGIEVRFAHDDLDLTTRGGRLTADLQAVIAADFIRNNREEVKKCMYGWVKQGYYPWPAPPGYLNQGKRRLKAVDPVRGPLVVKAFALYASGHHSVESLRHELRRLGLTTSRGLPLSRDAVSKLLRNPFYIGIIRIRRTGASYEGKHPALVARRIFDRVQALLDGRVVPRSEMHEFKFRRLIRCSCGRTLTGERQKGRVYYRCHGRTCHGVSLGEAQIEQGFVLPFLAALEMDEGEMGDIRAIVADLIAKERSDETERLERFERDLETVATRLDRLTDALLDGLIERDVFESRKERLLSERGHLLDAKTEGPDFFWTRMLTEFERGNVALNQYISADEAEKRKILMTLGSNFLFERNELVFSPSFPFSHVAKRPERLNGGPARAYVRTARRTKAELEALLLSLTVPDRGGAVAPSAPHGERPRSSERGG